MIPKISGVLLALLVSAYCVSVQRQLYNRAAAAEIDFLNAKSSWEAWLARHPGVVVAQGYLDSIGYLEESISRLEEEVIRPAVTAGILGAPLSKPVQILENRVQEFISQVQLACGNCVASPR